MANRNSSNRLNFGEFTLDLQRRALFCGNEYVELSGKPMEALIILVRNAGRVVSKAELLSAVWPEVNVSENVWHQALTTLRSALGDDTRRPPRYLSTVRGEGYRFIETVTGDTDSESAPETPTEPLRNPHRRLWIIKLAATA